jgi:hypothetical protein
MFARRASQRHAADPLAAAPLSRRALLSLGHDKLADEANLNLLSRADLLRAAAVAGIHAPRMESARLGGWTSNLLLMRASRQLHRCTASRTALLRR